jgi:hypothetical protein
MKITNYVPILPLTVVGTATTEQPFFGASADLTIYVNLVNPLLIMTHHSSSSPKNFLSCIRKQLRKINLETVLGMEPGAGLAVEAYFHASGRKPSTVPLKNGWLMLAKIMQSKSNLHDVTV